MEDRKGNKENLLWDRAQIEEGGKEEQFHREARFAADAARITDEGKKEKEIQEEEEEDWQKEDQMEVQWAEDEKLEEILERRRMEGSSLKAEVMQKVLELVVHEQMNVPR